MKYVVARYQEPVEWLAAFPNAILYNKGDAVESPHPVIPLENVGREGHTFAYHIVKHYDALDDYTCFLQGNPFDHTPSLEQALQLALQYIQIHPEPFYFLSHYIMDIDLSKDDTHPTLPPVMQDVYYRLFGIHKTEHPFQFGPGAQCIVSRDAIRRRPKSFYETILAMLGTSVHPPEGYAMERFWWMIFNGKE